MFFKKFWGIECWVWGLGPGVWGYVFGLWVSGKDLGVGFRVRDYGKEFRV